jgi:putative ABC transport system ATP-binding protein
MNSTGNNLSAPIALRGVTKSFGIGEAHVQVLQGIDLEIQKGEILLLVGPSGCGKTTLLSVLAGVLEVSGGEVEVFGRRVDQMSESAKAAFRRDCVGFVFQQFNLVPTLTAAENAAIPLLIRKESYSKAIEKARRFLEVLGLGDRTEFLPTQLSGGQQQRIAIARALIAEPDLLVCDEPTASLDGETGHQVMELLRAAGRKQNRAVLIVTHDSRIFPYGDRIAEMTDGRIISVRVNRGAPERS